MKYDYDERSNNRDVYLFDLIREAGLNPTDRVNIGQLFCDENFTLEAEVA